MLTSLVLDENSGLAENDKYDYSYNADGLRTEKRRYKLNNDKSSYYLYQLDEYVWENNILKGYKISYPGLADSNSYIVFPLYDDNNEIIGVSYKIILNDSSSSSSSDSNATENVLYFVKDAQGNIQKMVDQINDYEFIYKYDAYGKLISFTIPKEETKINNMPEKTFWDQLAKGIAQAGLTATYSLYKEINPFAYRSYFYDGETGLYYNQSRYYSPEWCRFINADDPNISTLTAGNISGANLFMYCNNDPVQNTDFYGYLAKHWYNKVSNVSKAIDIAIIAISCGKSLVGMKAIKTFIKANRNKLIKTVEKELLKLIGTTASAVVPAALDVALTLIGNSIGDLIAKALDYADPWLKRAYVRNNGYILN